jgi:hypothetical protein
MDLTFLPKRLILFCNGLVERHHKQHGYSEIAGLIWHKDTMGFVAIHEDLLSLLGAATASWKMRNVCLALSLAILILAVFTGWWIALGSIGTLIAARYFTNRTNSFYILISALMLALEMAGNNFGGLVTHLPAAQKTADARLREYLAASRTRFLDIYLPRRDEIPQEALTELASMLDKEDWYMTPLVFEEIYVPKPEASHGREAEEVVDLLVRAGIGVGKYDPLSTPPIFWRKAAKAANQLHMWLDENPTATPQQRLAHARKVVDNNRLYSGPCA